VTSLFKTLAIIAVSVALSWLAFGRASSHTTDTSSPAVETTYARVMRTGTLRCGYVAWPPFFHIDPNTKELTGIWREIIDPIADLMKWRVEYVEVIPDQKVTLLESGKIDVMCGDGTWVVESVKFLNFVKPFLYAPSMAYVRHDDNRFTTKNDLNNKDVTFVGIDGDLSIDLFKQLFPQANLQSLSATSDPAQMLWNVATRKADVVLTDTVTFNLFNKSNPDRLKIGVQEPIAVYGGSFSVLKKDVDLFHTLNEMTEMALNTGLIDQVLDRHDPERTLFIRTDKSYESYNQSKEVNNNVRP
jgi:ABC-type amino acid transport substrate-binding protein